MCCVTVLIRILPAFVSERRGGGVLEVGGVLCYSINPDPPSVCLRAPGGGGGVGGGVLEVGVCCVTVLIRILPAFVSERRRRGGGLEVGGCCVTVLIRILPAVVSECRRRGGKRSDSLCPP